MYKKIILSIAIFSVVTTATFATTTQDAMDFFRRYVDAANTYNPSITTMYAPDAKIVREVIKPDGEVVPVETTTARYVSEMKKSQTVAKVRHYTNSYSDISAKEIGKDTFKITALRQPKGETYKLKSSMVVRQDKNGQWQIIEEVMQTKVQMILHSK